MGIGDASILIGLITTVVLVGMAVGDIRRQVRTLVGQFTETQKWLKEIQLQANQNTTDLAVIDGILKVRAEREAT